MLDKSSLLLTGNNSCVVGQRLLPTSVLPIVGLDVGSIGFGSLSAFVPADEFLFII